MYNQENNKDMFETFMFRQNCNNIWVRKENNDEIL